VVFAVLSARGKHAVADLVEKFAHAQSMP
jgi:hypothetical protein